MNPIRVTRFAGINNRQPIDRLLPTDAGQPVHDALNVDLNTSGTFQRRPGYELAIALGQCRSLWDGGRHGAFVASGAELSRFDGETVTIVGQLTSGVAEVAYDETPVGVVWTDGALVRLISGDASQPLSPSQPNPVPSVAPGTGGSLVAGTYAVCFATVDAYGVRSSLTYPKYFDLADNGKIEISAVSAPVDVFITPPDGDVFYRYGRISSATDIGIFNPSGEPIAYQVIDSLPGGEAIAYHYGRLCTAKGGLVSYSLPYNLGLYRPAFDYIALDESVTLMASVVGGLYLATATKTYFLSGQNVADASLRQVANFGAIRGTLTKHPADMSVLWFSSRGPVSASPDGSLSLLQDKQVSFPTAGAGAAMYREENGLRQLVAALSPSTPSSGAVASSYMDAEVIK